MLIEFTVGNYRSFRVPQTLSMVAAPIKSKDPSLDQNSVFQLPNNPSLLTSAAVYGANASGKSNLVEALAFMKSFVMNSPKETNATGGIDAEPFRLSTVTIGQPSHFEIVFIESGKRYRYGFEVTSERITAEWLFFVPSTREARLFEREGDSFTIGKYFKEGGDLEKQTRPNALFLSVVSQFNGPTAQKLVAWFRKLGIISGLQDVGMRPFTLRQLLKGEPGEEIRRLICRLDLGITDIQVEKLSGQKPQLPHNMIGEMRQAYLTILNAADSEQIAVQTVHTRYDEEGNLVGQELFDLDEHESEGTQKLFAMSGPLLDTLQKGDVLVVDELDARLHPLMTREIILLFNQKFTNPNGAQLIFNTQDTNLLDNMLFRRDQIWFVEKDRQGTSNLYSLVEFRVRNDKDYERGYIQGRYGAIPYLSHIQTIVNGEYGEKA
ncbi:MAG: ATP-binding protein [Chloroflexi bacterium]|nr:ATP-binding protein [Chloroflexota bacterium]